MTWQFVPLEERHIPEATVLVREGIERERSHVSALPLDAARDALRDAVAHAIRNGTGTAAEESGRLAGFMAFYGPIENLFGHARGAVCPLHAHAASGARRNRLYSRLFEHAAIPVVAQGMTSLAITILAHDADATRALTLNAFGIRNADAIRDLNFPLEVPTVNGYTFSSLAPEDVLTILPLENGLIRHLRSSPTFLPIGEMTEEAFLARAQDARFYVAKTGSGIVGYVKVTKSGENLLTTVPGMLNISGAYLLPEHRGRGIYECLVAYVIATLRDKGIRLLGVDFETMNPNALRFWSKQFDIYTHSLVRRIDDGILDLIAP